VDLLAQRDRRQRALAVIMMVAMAAAISAGLRLKGRHLLRHRGAQPRQHLLQHRIGANAQETVADLRLRMPIPQVKGAAQQRVRIGAGNFIGRLRRGDHADHALVFAGQQIAVAQHGAAHSEHRHFFAAVQRGAQSAFLAQLIRQHQLGSDDIRLRNLGM